VSRAVVLAGLALAGALAGCERDDHEIVIGSKSFTESVILGETLRALVADTGLPARH